MSNAAAAYYAYLAHVDRERARVFRNFGYIASAVYVEARAKRYEREALLQSKEAAPVPDAASCSLGSHDARDDGLHIAP